MIKIITKLFTSPDKIKDSTIEIVIDPEVSPQETFDAAVKKVTADMLIGKITEDMVKMCYTRDEIDQTNAAIEEYGSGDVKDAKGEIEKKYPKAHIECESGYSSYYYFLKLPFSLTRLSERIVSDYMDAEAP